MSEWDWEEDGYSTDKSSIVYRCKAADYGHDALRRAMNNVTAHDISYDARRSLADKVGLSPSDFEYWAHDIKTFGGSDGIYVKVSAPNVWICADLLRGGSWYLDRTIFGTSGSLGQLPTHLLTWRQRVIKCKDFRELQNKLSLYRGKIWGLALFAHGNEWGNLTKNSQDKIGYNQSRIIATLSLNRYKLSKIYMMQCYSGYKGEVKVDIDKILNFSIDSLDYIDWADIKNISREDFINKNSTKKILAAAIVKLFKNQKDIKLVDIQITDESFKVKIDVNWDLAWRHYGIDVKNYKGMNAALIDTKIFDFEWIKELFK